MVIRGGTETQTRQRGERTTFTQAKQSLDSKRELTLKTTTGAGRSTPTTTLEMIMSLEHLESTRDTEPPEPFSELKILLETESVNR